MAFPKFHGLTIAQNAWIENLRAESLASDPTPTAAGQIWFNSTAKQIKFSTLNGGGAVVVQAIASVADVQAAIDATTALDTRVGAVETSYVKKDGTVAFTGDINAGGFKITNAANGVLATDLTTKGQLDAAIASLANAFNYVGVVTGGATSGAAYDMELTSAQVPGSYYKVTVAGYFKVGAAGTPFYANLNDGLVFNTTSGVDVIDNTDSTVAGTLDYIAVTGSTDTGYTVDIAATFKTRVSDAEAAITAEVARATAAEGVIATDLADEVDRATTAEGVLTTAIDDEETRALVAEGGLNTAISNEVLRATAAEDALVADVAELDTRVGPLASLTTTDKTSIVNAINEVKAAAGGGTGALKDAINAQRFTYLAGAPALEHVITHNLNTGFPDVTTWVKGDDTIFRNDVVSIEETSSNVITVTLTESRIIKATIQALDQLA